VSVRVRHGHRPVAATLVEDDASGVRVEFDHPVAAVTPGQAAVLYDGDTVLGGGWIRSCHERTGAESEPVQRGAN
jgi:tRNA-specific 2-thiouridylase